MATDEGFIYAFEYFLSENTDWTSCKGKMEEHHSLIQTLIYRRVNYIHNITEIKITVNPFT